MQLRSFNSFLKIIIKEGNRLQKVDMNGQETTTNKFTNMQLVALALAIAGIFALTRGFPDDFVRDIVVLLGIFIGLFTGAVISLHDKSKDLYTGYNEKGQIEKSQTIKINNYLIQFTGLTAYAILLALATIILLIFNLLFEGFKLNIWEYGFVSKFKDIDRESILSGLKI